MDKLANLRELMKKEGVEAYLIPHTDEFQSEYTAAYAERLRFLTGFTGSAGSAVVGQTQATFFTDGRYTLQAQDELDTSQYEIHNVHDEKPEDWIEKKVKGTVGYDPWLYTPNQLNRYEDKGLTLKPIERNLVDQVWGEAQPNRPINPFFLHGLKFCGEPTSDKCKKIGEKLKENEVDRVLITNPDSISWLLNIRGDDVVYTPVVLSYVFLAADGTYDFFVSLEKVKGQTYAHLSRKGRIIDINQIEHHLTKAGKIQLDPQSAPSALVKMLESENIKIIHAPDPCQLPKAIKNPTEIEGMRKAHIRDGVALVRFFAWLSEQPLERETTEWTASQKLHELRTTNEHFHDLSFDTISGYGPHGAVIHYRVTQDSALPLGRHSLYLVDSGAQYLDGTTDVTRTLCFGEPTPAQKDQYTRVLKGHIALATARFPKGTTGSQLDVLARHALWQASLDYDHGTGHGVGSFLGVHEGPQGISKSPIPTPLEPGMILSNEPGFYKEGHYGIRIESLVLIKDSAAQPDSTKPFYEFETITMAPLAGNLIEVGMLTDEEIDWVNGYQKMVFETLGTLLEEGPRGWLKKATSPL